MSARRRREEPLWLDRLVVDAVHTDQLREHGGLAGVRDENALKSALARPQPKWNNGQDPHIPTLAAAYAFGLVRNHPYRDGNKRIGFLAMATFLGLNDWTFEAADEEVVIEFLALAEGRVTEEDLSTWVRQHASTGAPQRRG
jgi:death-on-curing protein